MYYHRLTRALRLFASLCAIIVTASGALPASSAPPSPESAAGQPAIPASLPSPLAGGPRPTIMLNPNHGYMGQTITVTGQGVTPYTGVRVAWLVEGATQTAAEVSVGAANTYRAVLTVPGDFAAGSIKICATVTGTPLAEFACAAFTVDSAPPASVSGTIPLVAATSGPSAQGVQALAASVFLYSPSSGVQLSAPIAQDGSFNVDQVTPGTYTAYVAGSTPAALDGLVINVAPDDTVEMTFVPADRLICQDLAPRVSVSALSASPSAIQTFARKQLFGHAYWDATFGAYIRGGPAVNVTFAATLNGALDRVARVEFYYTTQGASQLLGSDSTAPYQLTTNVSALPTGTRPGLRVVPVLSSGCAEQGYADLTLIENPMAAPGITNGVLAWNGHGYDFWGTVPVLSSYPWLMNYDVTIPLQVADLTLRNHATATLDFSGSIGLDGGVVMRLFRSHRSARLCGIDVPLRSEDRLANPAPLTSSSIAPSELYSLGAPFEYYQPGEFSVSMEVLRFPFGIPYIAELRFSLVIGLHGSLAFDGLLYPWLGRLEAYLTPVVGVELAVQVRVVLLFFISGGAEISSGVDVLLPARVDTAA